MRPEDAIQRAVVQHLRARGARDLVFWHTPNGGKRRRVEAAIFKGLGVRAGVADIVALHRGRFYALELKAPGGRPTESQIQFLQDVNKAGGYSALCEGLDRALSCLETWGLLRGQARAA